MDWILGEVLDQCRCKASVSNIKVTNLIFSDDTKLFAKLLEVLLILLGVLHEKVKPPGPKVSWAISKVQSFGDLLDEKIPSAHE